jgi:hypothetical protein
MSFVCTYTGGNAQRKENLVKDSLIIPVGYDDALPRLYSLLIGFEVMAGGDLEYFFCLVEVDTEAKTERVYWSGLDVGRLVSKDDRPLIRLALLEGTYLIT